MKRSQRTLRGGVLSFGTILGGGEKDWGGCAVVDSLHLFKTFGGKKEGQTPAGVFVGLTLRQKESWEKKGLGRGKKAQLP